MPRVVLGDRKNMKNRNLESERDIFKKVKEIYLCSKHTCKRGIAMVMIACLSGREGLSSVDFRECAAGNE